jgi:hypothetical protein
MTRIVRHVDTVSAVTVLTTHDLGRLPAQTDSDGRLNRSDRNGGGKLSAGELPDPRMCRTADADGDGFVRPSGFRNRNPSSPAHRP